MNLSPGKLRVQVNRLVIEARLDELKQLALARWQTSIPEQALLDRIAELSTLPNLTGVENND